MRPALWSLGSALALFAACVAPDDAARTSDDDAPAPVTIDELTPTTPVSADEYVARSSLGVERIVPLRFYVLDDEQRTCPAKLTAAILSGAVREANAVYLAAGVQFTARVTTHTAPTFRDLREQDVVTWGDIWAELRSIVPTITAGTFSNFTAPERHFLHALATKLPAEEIPVFVPCSMTELDAKGNMKPKAPFSSFPWYDDSGYFWGDDSRLMLMPAASFGNPAANGTGFLQQTLAHELGHYLGLPHPFDLREMLRTGSPADAADFYDLFYSVTTGVPVPYANRDALEMDWNLFGLSGASVRIKSGNGTGTGGTAQCWASGIDGDLTCNWAGQTYRTSTHPDMVDGLGFAFPGGRFGVNVMDYLTVPGPDGSWNALASLSDTQIARVREVLRSPRGRRDQLGRGPGPLAQVRDAFGFTGVELDFSGDGLRDLAYFDWDLGACVVRASGTGEVMTIPLPGADASRGDTPVVADMNNDGLTDCVVFRPGIGVGNAQWLRQHTGSTLASVPMTFGSPGDEPLGNIKVKTGGAPRTWGIYTPSTGHVWFRTGSTNWSLSLGPAHGNLALADYDLDGYTDLAAWHAPAAGEQATLMIRRSREDYATLHAIPFGVGGDVPLGPVVRDGWAPTFAVWRPGTGQWFYLEEPGYADVPRFTEEQWGFATDVPLPGYDFDNDGWQDAAVYRPATQAGASGVLYVRGTAGAGLALAIGEPGDIPFLARDHNGDGPPELYLYRPGAETYFYVQSDGFAYPSYMTVPFGSFEFPPY